MRIEGDKIIIETVEQAETIAKLLSDPPKVNDKLKEALKKYRETFHGDAFEKFDLEI